jgi:hypothetical protein
LPLFGFRLGVRQKIQNADLPALSAENAETAFSDRRMTLIAKDGIVELSNVQP